MDPENKPDGFGKPAEAAVTDATADGALPTAGAVESNHNTSHKVNPILTANLIGKPDYNPMRLTGNRANDASDTTLVPETSKALVEEKGDRPTQRDNVFAGRDMAGNTDIALADDTVHIDRNTMIVARPGAKTFADKLAEQDKGSETSEAVRADDSARREAAM